MSNGARRSPANDSGRSVRKRLPRRGLAELVLPVDRDPLGILEEQHASRLKELVPVRVGRMLQSPFSFYRGTAAVMAADLRDAPTTDLEVVSCGDAHISNFGFFASPERALIFDLNDFDEGGVAPWEWDLRRLTASVHIGGRDRGLSEDACRDAVLATADAYRGMLRAYCRLSTRERFYTRVDTSAVARHFGEKGERTVRRAAKKARSRTSERLVQRLTTSSVDGGIRIADQPPVLRHVDHATLSEVADLFAQYRATVREDVAFLLEQYRVVDFALRVVGVGSVGTRCYLLAVEGPTGDMLFLQAKEAPPSVLTTYGGRRSIIPGHSGETDLLEGHRVVAAQRILQANSDLFVGWMRGWAGDVADRYRVDYYWRQFRDMKGSIDLDELDADQFRSYGALCASLLARAHGQSPASAAIVGYLGRSDVFADSTARWSAAYADVVEGDFHLLRRAVASGRLPAETGV